MWYKHTCMYTLCVSHTHPSIPSGSLWTILASTGPSLPLNKLKKINPSAAKCLSRLVSASQGQSHLWSHNALHGLLARILVSTVSIGAGLWLLTAVSRKAPGELCSRWAVPHHQGAVLSPGELCCQCDFSPQFLVSQSRNLDSLVDV
jgi:hypothetical protein